MTVLNRRTFLALASLSFSGACLTAPSSAAATLVPFDTFFAQVQKATPGPYVTAPGARVASPAAFAEMRAHVLKLYTGVHVKRSFLQDQNTFDCVPVAEQPSVRLNGSAVVATPPVPPGLSGAAGQPALAGTASTGGDTCDAGTIPMRRVTLEELSRFRSLHDFFAKGPDGAGQLPPKAGGPPLTYTHKYAHAYQNVTNYGGHSFLNLWRPALSTAANQIFSLSQHWYTNYRSDGKVQTVEGGWQKYPGKYGTAKPVLFIYYTADAYTSTGCYNLDCSAFVQTSSSAKLGGAFTNYSVQGGAQYDFELYWYLYLGNWWLYINGTAIGYYPGILYGTGPLKTVATGIDYGGETVGATSWPKMGSGKFPATGYSHAAYQRRIFYAVSTTTATNAKLTASQPSPSCYKIAVHNNTTTTNWNSYFYFGGPGGTGC